MKHTRAMAWAATGLGWLAAFFFLGSTIGGVQWIAHTGRTIPAALNLVMVALCFGAAYSLFSGRRLARGLVIPIVVLALLHLVNIFTFLLFAARVQAGFLTPLFLLSAFIPTNTGFTVWIPGYFNLFLLPALSLLLPFFGGNEEAAGTVVL
jgi:hypothetical protein